MLRHDIFLYLNLTIQNVVSLPIVHWWDSRLYWKLLLYPLASKI